MKKPKIKLKILKEDVGYTALGQWKDRSLLAQYIKGAKKPSRAQLNRIVKGVQQVGKELSEVGLLV